MKQRLVQIIFAFLVIVSLFDFQVRFFLTQPVSLACFALLSIVFLTTFLPENKVRVFRSLQVPLMVLLSFLMVFWLYGPNLQAKWWVIDDHEVMVFLGNDGKMNLSEWWGFYSKTEAFSPGTSLRYRPFYQGLRLIEIAAWDNNPGLWYLFRISIFTLFLASIWYVASRFLGFASAGVLTLYIFSYHFWVDIFARLGPSEAYSVFGLGLFMLSYYWAFSIKDRRQKFAWVGLAISSMICFGSKENMVILLAPLALLAGYSFYKKQLSSAAVLSLIISLGFGLFVLWASIAATQTAGKDIYNQSVSATSRLSLFNVAIRTGQSKEIIRVGVAAFIFFLIAWYAKQRQLVTSTVVFMFVLCCLLLLYYTQFVFYNGRYPDGSRYDFPGVLYYPVFITSSLYFVFSVFQKLQVPDNVLFGARWGVLFGITAIIFMKGFVPVQISVANNLERTQKHTSAIEDIVAQLETDPAAPVIFESADIWDFEPVYSNNVFLRTFGVENPFYLKITGYDQLATQSGSLESSLARQLVEISQQGTDSFRPIDELSNFQGDCFSIVLSGTQDTQCRRL